MNTKYLILLLALVSCPLFSDSRENVLFEMTFDEVRFQEADLVHVLAYIRTATVIQKVYDGNLPMELRFAPEKMTAPTTLRMQDVNLHKLLTEVCKQHSLAYKIEGDRIVLFDVEIQNQDLNKTTAPNPSGPVR